MCGRRTHGRKEPTTGTVVFVGDNGSTHPSNREADRAFLLPAFGLPGANSWAGEQAGRKPTLEPALQEPDPIQSAAEFPGRTQSVSTIPG